MTDPKQTQPVCHESDRVAHYARADSEYNQFRTVG